jgi:predicted RNase H-like HicB family nuclease
MAAVSTYHVSVTREGRTWLATVDDLPGAHTYARTLAALDRNVREVITLMADLPDEAASDPAAFQVTYRYDLGTDTLDHLQHSRTEAAGWQEKAAAISRQLVGDLVSAGVSRRDAAQIMGLSFQRVAQIAAEPADRARGER